MCKCDACKSLVREPLRSDVPLHLSRCDKARLIVGFVAVTTYTCGTCTTLWRWRVLEGWVPADATDIVPVNAAA